MEKTGVERFIQTYLEQFVLLEESHFLIKVCRKDETVFSRMTCLEQVSFLGGKKSKGKGWNRKMFCSGKCGGA